jgi:hypothetical protein
MNKPMFLYCLSIAMWSFNVGAQPVGNTKEAVQNTAQRIDDRRDLNNDRRDFKALADITQAWNTAKAANDKVAEKAADARLMIWLNQEQKEAQREVAENSKEAKTSAGEKGRSVGETVRSNSADDKRDLRDDRRDLRDDKRDKSQAIGNAVSLSALAQELRTLQPAFDAQTATPEQYARKAEVLKQLSASSGQQMVQDKKEIREDGRERREDNRERKEDRRGRRK